MIKELNNPFAAIVESTYPSFLEKMKDPKYSQERAILAPTHDIIDLINEFMLTLVPDEEKTYLNSDTI